MMTRPYVGGSSCLCPGPPYHPGDPGDGRPGVHCPRRSPGRAV